MSTTRELPRKPGQFQLRQLFRAMAWFGIALGGWCELGELVPGGNTGLLATACFAAMPIGLGAAIGELCGNTKLGALIGVTIGLPLAPFFHMMWAAADC